MSRMLINIAKQLAIVQSNCKLQVARTFSDKRSVIDFAMEHVQLSKDFLFRQVNQICDIRIFFQGSHV